MSPPDRRRRRARRPTAVGVLLVAVVLAVLIGGALHVGRASGPYWRSIDRSYADQGAVLMEQSNRSAARLGYVLGTMASTTRVVLQDELDQLVRTTTRTAEDAAALQPPSPWNGLGTTFAGVLGDRARAVGSLERAVDGLLDMGSPSTTVTTATTPGARASGPAVLTTAQAADDLGNVGTLLERADDSYHQVRRHFRQAPGSPQLPASTWVTRRGAWDAPAVQAMVGELAASPSLAAVHDVVVVPNAVSVTPAAVPPVGAAAGTSLLPAHRITVTAVIANKGNVAEHALTVTASVRPLTAGSAARSSTRVSVSPGSSVAVPLPALAVTPGQSYDLTVAVSPPPGQVAGGRTSQTFAIQVAPAFSPPPTTTTTTTTQPHTAKPHTAKPTGTTKPAKPTGTTKPAKPTGTTKPAGKSG